jgi:tripartite ATP-independent transporter DctP family solute receptor
MKRFIPIIVTCLFCITVSQTIGEASTIKIKFASIPPPGTEAVIAQEHFKKFMETASKGRVEVGVFPASQLGNEKQLIEGVQMGNIEMALITSATMTNFVPQVGLFDLPYLFPDVRTAEALLDGDVGRKVLSYFPSKGMLAYGYGMVGVRVFSNSKRPVKTLADMKGLKFRSIESPVFIEMYKALGTNPVAMPWGETQQALKTGVVDGWDNSLYFFSLTKNTELGQKYVTVSDHIYSACVLIANPKWFNGLPKDIQVLFREGAHEWTLVNRATVATKKTDAIANLLKVGTEITFLSPEARTEFVQATRRVHKSLESNIGKDLIEETYRAIDKLGKM